MKQLFVFLLALCLSLPAMSATPHSDIIIVNNDIAFSLDLGDLSEYTPDQLAEIIDTYLIDNLAELDDELECSVSVKGSIDVGVGSVEVEVTVSGPCSEVRAQGKAIAKQVLDDIKAQF